MTDALPGRLVTLAGAALFVLACAAPQSHPVRPQPHRAAPTLDEYSAGTSRLAADFGAAFKAKDAKTLATILSSRLLLTPADKPSAPTFESPSGLRVQRFGAGSAALTGEAAISMLSERRERFQGIVRNELHVVGIEGSGERRTVRVHSFFAGPASDRTRRQDDSWWRWEVVARPAPPAGRCR